MCALFKDECAVQFALKILSRKWSNYIICELLLESKVYFNDIKNALRNKYGETISSRVLSDNLSFLEESKIVEREELEGKPQRVSYSLTERGKDFKVIFAALKGWGVKWGSIKQKKCKSFTCIHNAVPYIDIDEAPNLFNFKPIE